MGVNYQTVLWNGQKKVYDRLILGFVLSYLILFVAITAITNPETTPETLIIRSFGSLAVLMLHVILMIGPLSRLNKKFLPFLYNRRHLGVSMFLVAAVHGIFSIIQFHSLGNVSPITSLFTSNMDYGSLTNFPFQVLGFFALLILFLMASTSHDFWLANLGARTWKTLHMMVYLAYVLVILHVFLGAFQQETSPLLLSTLGVGMAMVIGLHLRAGFGESVADKGLAEIKAWEFVCDVEEIEENRAKMVCIGTERIAIFKYGGLLSAVNNVCRHQGGPLGEGKIIDGCITCPWHGYQYQPADGQSPPPFKEKVETYGLKLEGNKVYVDPKPNVPGTPVEPIKLS